MAEEKPSGGGAVIRFDGTRPEECKEWEIYAKSHLRKKKQQGLPEEGLGDELVTMITPNSLAFKVVKKAFGKNFDEMIVKKGAEKLLFQALVKRFPPQTEKETKNTAMSKVTDLCPFRDGKTQQRISRIREWLDDAAEAGVDFPSPVRSDMVLESIGMRLGA